ncbi:hypothetical protein SAMN05446927_6797 [Caballeronia arationis]|uniref:Uncharacterized protein n=1 Tax=Caballeronia arationis TaxID=1777142 RepID=A0A7Z7ICH9_9BURK|nr:hypothetical protein SAMN05446927_6797 [Caballeronia arationis]
MMLGEGLVDSPFTMSDSLFPLVVGAFHLLRKRCDFADFRDSVNGRLAPK